MTIRAVDIAPGSPVLDRNGVELGVVRRVEEDRFCADIAGEETWLPYGTTVSAEAGRLTLGLTAGEVPGATVAPPTNPTTPGAEADFATEYDQAGFAVPDDGSGQPRSVEQSGETQEGR